MLTNINESGKVRKLRVIAKMTDWYTGGREDLHVIVLDATLSESDTCKFLKEECQMHRNLLHGKRMTFQNYTYNVLL
jgi:hypothetical protein